MIVINIALGLVGLGLVILVHEFGHFIAAKASGITVEAFSIGWGKKIAGFTRNGTEYRISILPIGGFCKMKGEEILKSAIETGAEGYSKEDGSLFSVSPLRRIATYFAGPGLNFLFAILVLSIIWFAGFTTQTFDSRIIMLSETSFGRSEPYPADFAELMTGDRIIELNGKEINNFQDIEAVVTPNAEKRMTVVVDRFGRQIESTITPELDRDTGAGFIGVAAWVEPIIAQVDPASDAAAAGLTAGDRIVEVNGIPIENSIDLYSATRDSPSELNVTVSRDGGTRTVELPARYTEEGDIDTGFAFATISAVRREANPLVALWRGTEEAFETFMLSIRSIGMLFRGVNVKNAVGGPIRITYFVGEIATSSFSRGFGTGMIVVFRFLSLISIALGFMNLLPIPALDGGMIVFLIGEIILGKPIKPKIFYRYQIVGFLIIISILVLTTFNDLFFFIGR